MKNQVIFISIRKFVCKTLFIVKKVLETISYICTKEKILLNVWMRLFGNRVVHSNFGDELNYYIVKSLTNKPLFNLPCIFLHRNKENYLVIGSIIESHTNKNSIIWGSGSMYGGERPLREKPKKVLAVRGPLTRKYLLSQGVECPKIYGDPALLLPQIYHPKVTKKYKLGVIPHFVDFDSEYLSELKCNPNVKVIRLRGYKDWHKVIDEICECEFIISSSLHGLILSDAYSVPNKWIKLSDRIYGGNFKFHDYFMSVNREVEEPLIIKHTITINELFKYKEQYIPINWNPESLLNVSPF